jgi:hypothetical protein
MFLLFYGREPDENAEMLEVGSLLQDVHSVIIWISQYLIKQLKKNLISRMLIIYQDMPMKLGH